MRGDSPVGTAPPAARFVLIEQPGPWGRDALAGSRLPAEVIGGISRAASARGARVLMIRRPGRAVPREGVVWGLVETAAGAESVTWGVAAPGDLPAAAAGELEGTVDTDPAYLVCAHSRHDACCAVRGRPIAHALSAVRPGRVWECSHVGGCRFAANVVVLPYGLYYGHVPASGVADLADAADDGRLVPALLRGRAGTPGAVQAAQGHARLHARVEATGADRIDAFASLGWEQRADGVAVVRLADGAEEIVVGVRRVPAGPPVLLTCSARSPELPPEWELVSMSRQPRSSATA